MFIKNEYWDGPANLISSSDDDSEEKKDKVAYIEQDL